MTAKTKIGVVAFSFAQRDRHQEPNPCNRRLGTAVERIVNGIKLKGFVIWKAYDKTWGWNCRDADFEDEPGYEPVVVVQWEIGFALEESDTNDPGMPTRIIPGLIVNKHRRARAYLDSDEVMAQAAKYFRQHGVKIVVPVANRFLLLRKCRKLVLDAGFEILDMPEVIGRIGFDPESNQWWTRGRIRVLWYAILQKLFNYRG